MGEEISRDPHFQDLSYKIETNAHGQIVMSPTPQRHGNFQHRVGRLFDSRAVLSRPPSGR